MDSELLTCLLKFIAYFPDYLSALSRTLLRFVWTTFVETAEYLGRVLLDRNTWNRRYLCSFGSYFAFEINGI